MRVNFSNYQAPYISKKQAKNRQNASFGTNVEAVSEFLIPILERALYEVNSPGLKNKLEVSSKLIREELTQLSADGMDSMVKTQVENDARGEWLTLSRGHEDAPSSFKSLGRVYLADSSGEPTPIFAMTEALLKVLRQ